MITVVKKEEMKEIELYEKLYARMMSGVDQTLQLIAGALASQDYSREKIVEIGTLLKETLLDTEDLFMVADVVEWRGRPL